MRSAKEIHVAPISAKDANNIVKKFHYSGKVVNNSQLHFGVFIDGRCEGAMSFGPSMDKRKIQILVRDTSWNGFLELNRMAFGPKLPRNSESRALSVAMKIIKNEYPHIQWIVSFSDGTQCGDGTIYRASGFHLVGIKKNTQIVVFPDGRIQTRLVLTNTRDPERIRLAKLYGIQIGGAASLKPFLDYGCRILNGYQLKYIYFLDNNAKDRLMVPILPFSEIDRIGARMYKGKSYKRAGSIVANAPSTQEGEGGAEPTPVLHIPTQNTPTTKRKKL